MKMGKITIKNLYKTEGITEHGVSITEWLTHPDRYEFLSYSQGHKWMYSLNRVSNGGKYELTLHAAAGVVVTKPLGLNEITIKRLFYMRVGELVTEHFANVMLQMTFTNISSSLQN
jgi:hypothetical protein